jgi:hypothetical protein
MVGSGRPSLPLLPSVQESARGTRNDKVDDKVNDEVGNGEPQGLRCRRVLQVHTCSYDRWGAKGLREADYQSAIQQNATLRYERKTRIKITITSRIRNRVSDDKGGDKVGDKVLLSAG